jgi:hypothetical protein
MEYLCYRWPQICYVVCRSHNIVLLFSWMIYHRTFNKSSTTVATIGAGTDYPSRASEFFTFSVPYYDVRFTFTPICSVEGSYFIWIYVFFCIYLRTFVSNTISISGIIPLYNIYSTYIEIRLVETIPRDIYQNIVFPSQQYRISLSTISYFPYSKFSRFNTLVI